MFYYFNKIKTNCLIQRIYFFNYKLLYIFNHKIIFYFHLTSYCQNKILFYYLFEIILNQNIKKKIKENYCILLRLNKR